MGTFTSGAIGSGQARTNFWRISDGRKPRRCGGSIPFLITVKTGILNSLRKTSAKKNALEENAFIVPPLGGYCGKRVWPPKGGTTNARCNQCKEDRWEISI